MSEPRGGHRCSAVSASPAALGLASAAVQQPARVHSVFRSAVNVETSDGLLTLATIAGGGLPNGILLETDDLRALGLRPGMVLAPSPGGFAVPSAGLVVDLTPVTLWSPRFTPRREHASRLAARWITRSATAWRVARSAAPRGGLRPLYWATEPGGQLRAATDAWLPRARVGLEAVAGAIVRRDRAAAVLAADTLIGLGEGGTPSGDDALVGVEAALHALGDPMAGFLADALDGIDERTTMIAAAFLWHAALGEFAERLHDLIGALLDPDDEAVGPAITRAAGYGATSGADGMLGVLRTLDAISGRAIAAGKSA
jgi:hypothetical protein